ncbi:MAG TPA: hemerythrin domain-containing protein [Methylomirabilota bacterium]|jgi:iron-sulfur cluster repair protein YtfE (RIC family)|nr:hemerythrin domain-containing protein [Methylomirabilota bacterium]
MDAIQFLKQEHEKAKQAFGQILDARGDQRGQLWKKLKPELKVHEQMEEAALYGPVGRDAGSDHQDLKDWEEHHHEEVTDLESLVQEVDGLEPADDAWLEKLQEVHETLEHHIEEEEGNIWPQIREVWNQSKLEEAGKQMESMKKQKMREAA